MGQKRKLSVELMNESFIGMYALISDARGYSGWWVIQRYENEEGKVYCIVNNIMTKWSDRETLFRYNQIMDLSPIKPVLQKNEKTKKRHIFIPELTSYDPESIKAALSGLDTVNIPKSGLPPKHPLLKTRFTHIPILPELDILGMYSPNDLASVWDIARVTGISPKVIQYSIFNLPDDHPNKLRPDKNEPPIKVEKDYTSINEKYYSRYRSVDEAEKELSKSKKFPVYVFSKKYQQSKGKCYFRWEKVWWWYYNRLPRRMRNSMLPDDYNRVDLLFLEKN